MTEKVSKQIYVNQDKGLVTQSKHIQALKSIYRILNTHEPRNQSHFIEQGGAVQNDVELYI